jgi:hypothetical protein
VTSSPDELAPGTVAVTTPVETTRVADSQPLTERILPQAGLSRWLAIVVWSLVPMLRLVVVAALVAAAGLVAGPGTYTGAHLSGALLNTYLLVVVLIGIRPIARRVGAIALLGGHSTERVAALQASVLVPILIALLLTVTTESVQLSDFSASAITSNPIPFAIAFLGTFVMRVPEGVAFWVFVVALLTVAALGRQPVPGSFPEDRSLGLKAVGQMLTTLLFLYIVILGPSLLFGTSTLIGLISILALMGLGLAAMLVAVWAMHMRMAAERAAAVGAARAQYAVAYRAARANPTDDATRRLQATRLLLDGAESIHEWPFDDRTQRIAGLLLSGVITGVVVRLVLIALGV